MAASLAVSPVVLAGDGAQEDGSPWGIASGAEWSGDYPQFNPMLGEAGVFAHWASADGGTRRCPVKDMRYWRDHVSETMKRYRTRITCWEVWNEFNGSFAVDGMSWRFFWTVRGLSS